MSRITLVTLAAFFTIATRLEAQTPSFMDGGFENCWEWYNNPTPNKNDYWDFKEIYFLTTLNSLHQLEDDMGDAPLTAFRLDKVTDVYDEKYSLKLVSDTMTLGERIIFLPGVAATLSITFVPMSCVLGRSFTARPTELRGVYNYTPVNGDSAAIEIQLLKKGEVLGSGKQVIKNRVPNWANFSVPVEYTSNDTPDTIIVIFAASGNYDFTNIDSLMNCKGQRGSTLCLDNVAFGYQNDIKELFDPAVKLNIYPNPSSEKVSLQIAKEINGTVIIYDYLTRKTGEYPIYGSQIDIDVRNYAAGSYLINVMENDRVVTTGRFLKE